MEPAVEARGGAGLAGADDQEGHHVDALRGQVLQLDHVDAFALAPEISGDDDGRGRRAASPRMASGAAEALAAFLRGGVVQRDHEIAGGCRLQAPLDTAQG
ncbi:MAG: hypothetical protein R3F54_22170 [Alphaproteobacteria bacterium]